MKHPAFAAVIALVLAACAGTPPQSGMSESSMAAEQATSAASSAIWTSFEDATLGIQLDYPANVYRIEEIPADDVVFNDKAIRIEAGFRFSDILPEGDDVHLFRTKDAAILDYLQQDGDLAAKTMENGTQYHMFTFQGMGSPYGYIIQKYGYYYVFQALWGPDNPTAERMFRSLVIR